LVNLYEAIFTNQHKAGAQTPENTHALLGGQLENVLATLADGLWSNAA